MNEEIVTLKEYKILRDTDSELTKKLNNWRHDFHIEIIAVLMDTRVTYSEEWISINDHDVEKQLVARPWGNLVVVLTRERKDDGDR